jgi:uncharacterized membrane-anchored protein YitT (DUF2179 family)
MTIDHTKIWRSTKDYLFITLGVAIYAIGFSSFILPHEVVIGGLTGLSTILYFTTGLPIAVSSYALNLILLAMAYKVVGKQFVLGTIFGATMISVMMAIFNPICPGIFDLDPFLSCVIGGIMSGIGIGMAFVHNGSTGGTDIIAAMVAKRTNVTIGRMMIYVDMCIISSSYFIFGKIDTVVYGFIVLFMCSYMADLMINTNRQAVQFIIFSSRWQEIATAINNQAKRGCTVINGMGWYSKQDVKVLLVMARKIESVVIFRIIKSIDRDAFITQANVNGVYGRGFDEMKVRMKMPDASVHAHVEEHPHIGEEVKATPSGHRMI